jgi:hypothetical protein
MSRQSSLRSSVILPLLLLLVFALVAGAAQSQRRGRRFKPPPPVSRITVTVLRNDNDTPISNAHVIFHPVEGNREKGGMELKTNDEGQAVMTIIPIGDTVLLQVIAKGYETYGGKYTISKADESMHIKMKLPGQQYSVYDNHDEAENGSGSGSAAGQNGNAASSKDAQNGSPQDSSKK